MFHLVSPDTFDLRHLQDLAQVWQALGVRLLDDQVLLHVVQADEEEQLDPDPFGVRQVFHRVGRDGVVGQEADHTPNPDQVGLAVLVRLFAARLNQVDLLFQGQVRLALELAQEALLQLRPAKE